MSDSGDDQNDRDIREAIAASLRDFYGHNAQNQGDQNHDAVVDLTGDSDNDDIVGIQPKSNSVIGIDTDDEATEDPDGSDDDDEDLRRAIELSKQDSSHDQSSPRAPLCISDNEEVLKPGASQKPQGSTDEQNTSQPMGVLGLNRKQMEQERLARLAKRKLEDNPSIDEPEKKQLKMQTSPKAQMKTDLDKLSDTISSSTKPQPSRPGASTPSPQPSVQFPSGVVKKTWVYSSPRLGDDIKIEEVFQKAGLELAVLSSFMWDMDWLFSKLDTRNSRFLLMMQAKDDSTVGICSCLW